MAKSTRSPTGCVVVMFHGLPKFAPGPPPRDMHDANSNRPCQWTRASLLHGHGPWLMCEVTLETKTCIRRGVVTSEPSNWPTLMAVGIQNWRRRTKWKSGSGGTKFISLTVWTMKHPRHGRMTSLVKMMPPIAFVVRPQSFIPVKLYWVSLVSNTQVRGVLYKKKGYISYHLWIGSYLLFIPIFLFTWKLPKANFFSVKL